MSNVKVATQFGLPYLPLIVMQHDKLWEQQAKKRASMSAWNICASAAARP